MAATPRALRGDQPSELDSGLAEAQRAVETRLDELRGRRDLARAPGASETDAFLARLDAGRRLVDCQLAIEAWLTEWRQSAAPERH